MTSSFLWTLIAIQIAMGAFDTLYHHELTERLAWRPSQRHELQLHSVRNTLYALLFLTLGWLEVRGFWAMIVTKPSGVMRMKAFGANSAAGVAPSASSAPNGFRKVASSRPPPAMPVT